MQLEPLVVKGRLEQLDLSVRRVPRGLLDPSALLEVTVSLDLRVQSGPWDQQVRQDQSVLLAPQEIPALLDLLAPLAQRVAMG